MATVKFRYIADGVSFHHGIPARDLTTEDWARLTPEQQQTVENSVLYEAAEKRRDEAAKTKELKGGPV